MAEEEEEAAAAVVVLEAVGLWGWEAFSKVACQNYGQLEVNNLTVVSVFYPFISEVRSGNDATLRPPNCFCLSSHSFIIILCL